MPIVVDASVAISWFFAAEQTAAVDALWDQAASSGIAVPTIWSYEIANRLGRAIAAGATTTGEVTQFFNTLSSIATDVMQPTPIALTERMVTSGLTAYDAAYLEIAAARGIPLATLDRRLREAAAAEGISVLPESVE